MIVMSLCHKDVRQYLKTMKILLLKVRLLHHCSLIYKKGRKKHSEAGQVNGSDKSLKADSVAQFLLIFINA